MNLSAAFAQGAHTGHACELQLIQLIAHTTFVIAGDDGMENADLASQFVGAIAALAGHASGAGGGEIIAGKQNKPWLAPNVKYA